MIHTHVRNRGPAAMRSAGDRILAAYTGTHERPVVIPALLTRALRRVSTVRPEDVLDPNLRATIGAVASGVHRVPACYTAPFAVSGVLLSCGE